ncbi:MAG: DUF445 family protein, partial [Clostridiales bacterium]|nr:DUF445 family protein [Clostridiales bacterium]
MPGADFFAWLAAAPAWLADALDRLAAAPAVAAVAEHAAAPAVATAAGHVANVLIGAWTGYITNYIALQMIFKDYGFGRLRFGGLISRTRGEFVAGVAMLAEDELINQDTLKERLRGEKFKQALADCLNAAAARIFEKMSEGGVLFGRRGAARERGPELARELEAAQAQKAAQGTEPEEAREQERKSALNGRLAEFAREALAAYIGCEPEAETDAADAEGGASAAPDGSGMAHGGSTGAAREGGVGADVSGTARGASADESRARSGHGGASVGAAPADGLAAALADALLEALGADAADPGGLLRRALPEAARGIVADARFAEALDAFADAYGRTRIRALVGGEYFDGVAGNVARIAPDVVSMLANELSGPVGEFAGEAAYLAIDVRVLDRLARAAEGKTVSELFGGISDAKLAEYAGERLDAARASMDVGAGRQGGAGGSDGAGYAGSVSGADGARGAGYAGDWHGRLLAAIEQDPAFCGARLTDLFQADEQKLNAVLFGGYNAAASLLCDFVSAYEDEISELMEESLQRALQLCGEGRGLTGLARKAVFRDAVRRYRVTEKLKRYISGMPAERIRDGDAKAVVGAAEARCLGELPLWRGERAGRLAKGVLTGLIAGAAKKLPQSLLRARPSRWIAALGAGRKADLCLAAQRMVAKPFANGLPAGLAAGMRQASGPFALRRFADIGDRPFSSLFSAFGALKSWLASEASGARIAGAAEKMCAAALGKDAQKRRESVAALVKRALRGSSGALFSAIER